MLSVDTLIGKLAPHLCISCGVEGSVLCSDCVEAYFQPNVSRCAGCFELTPNFKVCIQCRAWLPLKVVFVSCTFEGIYEQLIKSLKFDYKRQAVEPISVMLNQTIYDLPDNTIICPIPTAPSRVRERGFDHSKKIAKAFSKKSALKYENFLFRRTNVRQLGSGREKRIKQMEAEFHCSEIDVKNKNILIVDDVMTTGSTLAGAAKVLKNAGAKAVYGAVFARKV